MTKVSLLAIVKRAREILTPESAWTKGAFGRNAMGSSEPLDAWDGDKHALNPQTVCFCSLGAVRRAALELDGNDSQYVGPFQEAALNCVPEPYRIGGGSFRAFADIITFNDIPETKHADVLAVFDCTIAKLEAAEAGE